LDAKDASMPGRKHAERSVRRKEADDVSVSRTNEAKAKAADLKAEIDDILSEIDNVLESNAQEFVDKYVQRGGQ
jgi:prokaryotic ubiquitin-like protein Pup